MGHIGTIPRVRELNAEKSWPPDPVRGRADGSLTTAQRADLIFIARWILRPTRPAPDLRYWVKQARTRLLEADAELGPI
jgi:hypothetical protein